jgi:hypothetical protein
MGEEVGLLINIIGDVIIRVVHIFLQDIYIQFVELGVAGLVLLALLQEYF